MPSGGLRPCSCIRLTPSCAAWLLPLAWMPGAWFPGFRVPGWLFPWLPRHLAAGLPGLLLFSCLVPCLPGCLAPWYPGHHGSGSQYTAHRHSAPPGHTPLLFQNGTLAISNRLQTGGALCSWSAFPSCVGAVCGAVKCGMYGRLLFPKGFQPSPSTESRGLEEVSGPKQNGPW